MQNEPLKKSTGYNNNNSETNNELQHMKQNIKKYEKSQSKAV